MIWLVSVGTLLNGTISSVVPRCNIQKLLCAVVILPTNSSGKGGLVVKAVLKFPYKTSFSAH